MKPRLPRVATRGSPVVEDFLNSLHIHADESVEFNFAKRGSRFYIFTTLWAYHPQPLAARLRNSRFSAGLRLLARRLQATKTPFLTVLFTLGLGGASVFCQQDENIPSETSAALRQLEAPLFINYMLHVPVETLIAQSKDPTASPIIVAHTVDPMVRVGGLDPGPRAWLHVEAANANLIAIGRPLKRESSLVPDRSFVFTDYEFKVETIIKGYGPIYEGRQIVVTRPGGSLQIDGREFRAIEPQLPQFELNHRYLLFLRGIPDTNTFLVQVGAAFHLEDGQISSMRAKPRYMLSPEQESPFIEELNEFVARTGQHK
jgi:hypothetical protein